MHLYHPMMFVGLGGTGCRIGAELERRLREEVCGADGRRLHGAGFDLHELRPYELPACFQFVYADLSEDELGQLKRRSVPNENYAEAAVRNAYYAQDLLPQFASYPEVAKNLRVRVPTFVRDWLPPIAHEPMVTPLRLGAGQLPTVGRAALFETLANGVEVARSPIRHAIGAIKGSQPELRVLNPDHKTYMTSVDVFVAFSVAGGTGAGIFYDYLHLVDSAFAAERIDAKIYPLVLMPTAFDENKGGGLYARLNAGRALLDLFRLIDDLNQDRRSHGELQDTPLRQGLHVHYPDERDLEMRLGAMDTAFLFSKSAGIRRDDLHRSVVALMLSLIGQEQPTEAQGGGEQSFATTFINRAVDRQSMAATRIGRRSVSTSLVGALIVPFDDLSDLFAERMLARAVGELRQPPPGRAEVNHEHIKNFFGAAGAGAIWQREPPQFQQPTAVKGAAKITKALHERVKRMEDALRTLDQNLVMQAPEIAKDFDPNAGGRRVLGDVDIFRLMRVVVGHPDLTQQIDQLGVEQLLDKRRVPPDPPSRDWGANPPAFRPIRNRFLGLVRARWASPPVRRTMEDQDRWYYYRTYKHWHAHWAEQRSRWHSRMDRFVRQLRGLIDTLETHARNGDDIYTRRVEELYRPRVGVTYQLPPWAELEHTYEQVMRRLVLRRLAGRLRDSAAEGEIVHALVGPDGWRDALAASLTTGQGPDVGLRRILSRLKEEVARILRDEGDGDAPLLPHMGELLRAAAGQDRTMPVADADVQHFVATLSGMMPAAFVPEGTGPLSVLVVYPAAARDNVLERFLSEHLDLPRGAHVSVDFRSVDTEAITVVLMRSSMGVTEVPELRLVLLDWAEALRAPKDGYYLPWRQRLGFDQDWLATTEEHRVEILQRLLSAMWNGQVSHTGPRDNPTSVRIALQAGDPDAEAMILRPTSFGAASSWGSLLRAYEEWTLHDGGPIRLNFCRTLMEQVPSGFTTRISRPDPLYMYFVGTMVGREIKTLTDMRQGMRASTRHRCDQFLGFWEKTVPAARERTFMGEAPNGDCLLALEDVVGFHAGPPGTAGGVGYGGGSPADDSADDDPDELG